MAKRVTRSDAIREYLAVDPDAGPKTIIAELGKKGIVVSASLVSQVKYAKNGHGPTATRRGGGRAANSANVSLDDLIKAKTITDRLGGLDRAREALAMLERLQGKD